MTAQRSLWESPQLYRHKRTGELMTMVKTTGNVGTFKLENPEPYMLMGMMRPGNIAICAMDNVEALKS